MVQKTFSPFILYSTQSVALEMKSFIARDEQRKHKAENTDIVSIFMWHYIPLVSV